MQHLIIIPLLFLTVPLLAQQTFTVDEALEQAKKNHPAIRAAMLQEQQAKALQAAAIEVPKTEISYMKGQYNSANRNDNNITVTQTLPLPTLWRAQHQTARVSTMASEANIRIQENEITTKLLTLIQKQLFLRKQQQLLQRHDSLFNSLVKAFELRYQTGEGTLLEKTAILTQHHELQNMLRQNEVELAGSEQQLQLFLQTDNPVRINATFEALPEMETTSPDLSANPTLLWQSRQTQVAKYQQRVARNKLLPDLSIGYFTQTLIGYQTINGQEKYFDSAHRFNGFTLGISLPIWFSGYTANSKAARLHYETVSQQEVALKLELQQSYQLALQDFTRNKANLEYYRTSALPNALLLEKQSLTAFQYGEIDYASFILNLQQALRLNQNYLQALLAYNESLLSLNKLQGKF